MKKKSLITLTLLGGILTSYPQSILAAERAVDPAALEASVNRVQQRVQDFAEVHPDAICSVVVIGAPRIGKTSLHHLLANKPIIAEQANPRELRLHVDANNLLPGFRISHTGERGTLEPCMWYDPQNRLKLFDFPGNNDPEGPQQVILNAIFAHQLIQNQANAKVLFALAENDLDGPGYENLSEKFGRLVDMFESMDQLKQGLNVVITKHTNLPETIFQEVLQEADANHRNLLNTNRDGKVINLIRFLAANGATRVSFFSKPTQLGAYDRPADRLRILNNLIANTNPIAYPRVNIAVTPQARELVGNLGLRLNASLAEYIRIEEVRLITNHCMQEIINLAPNDITALRTAMGNIAGQLNTIVQQISPDNPLNFSNQLNGLLQADRITARINTITFLKRINDAVNYDTQAWGAALNGGIQQVTSLSAAPAANVQGILPSYEYGNGILTLRGTILGTSDVNRAVAQLRASGNNNPINTLKVYSFNTLLIDADLRFPGTLTCLLSPHLRVVGPARILNLSGAHGTVGDNGAMGVLGVNGGVGQPGLPGTHGQHGGHFYGKAHTYENINALTVNTMGGNGGRGGNGGNGANGIAGNDGVLLTITNTSQDNGEYSLGNNQSRRFWETHQFYGDKGTDGTPGQNSGQGGRGGLAGKNGTVLIDGQWNNPIQNAVAQAGGNGDPGIVGVGGTHGRHCQGEVVIGTEQYTLFKNQTLHIGPTKPVEKTITNRGYIARDPERASSGIVPPGLNDAGQLNQLLQIPLNGDALKQEYRDAYNAQTAANPFVRSFPNL